MSLAAQCRQEVLRLHLNLKIGADVPEVAVEGKFGPCAYTSDSRCPMSHSWFSRLWVKAGLGPQLEDAGTRTMCLRKPD